LHGEKVSAGGGETQMPMVLWVRKRRMGNRKEGEEIHALLRSEEEEKGAIFGTKGKEGIHPRERKKNHVFVER